MGDKKGPGDLTPQEMAVWFAAWMDGEGIEFPEDIRVAARRAAKKLAKVLGDFSVEDFFRFHIVEHTIRQADFENVSTAVDYDNDCAPD